MKRADLYQAIRDEATARGIAIEHGKCLVDADRPAMGYGRSSRTARMPPGTC